MHGEAPWKIVTILKVSAFLFVLCLILFWLFAGGIGKSVDTGKSFYNPIAFYMGDTNATGTLFHLPWRPDQITKGPDINDIASTSNDYYGDGGTSQASDPRTYGNPSPRRNQIILVGQATSEQDSSREYLSLSADPSNSSAILLSGWSLQSAVTGIRIFIPLGTSNFVQGAVNGAAPILLEPGTTATIVSGVSPVGTSFRENICTGYLNELQSFTPDLSTECPDPSGMMPLTADNIRIYGETCPDFVGTAQRCHFPTDIPSNISSACHSFISDNLSYNGCARAHQADANFLLPSWRIYLGAHSELWQNIHDVIRLLDEKGQVVDVLTY